MYIKIHDKEWILDFIRKSDCWSEQINHIFQDRDFDVYTEVNTKTSERSLKAELVVRRNARGLPVQTSHNRCHMVGNLYYYATTKSMHLIITNIIGMYKYLYNRKRKYEANIMKKQEPMTGEEFTDMLYGPRTRVTPEKAVYYICNLTSGILNDKRVQFLYKHPAFDNKIEFVSDNDSRCTWFYSERDVKNFIAKHRYKLTIDCENAFVVKAVRVGRITERTFYNLDLDEERYDLYGPVESCCKRLARYSQIGENKPYDNIYISTASRGRWPEFEKYFKMDMEAVNWTREFMINQAKEIVEEMKLPKIKKVIFNKPATIVFWGDESKTVVKCENEEFDPEKGLSMAISKKALGNNHDYYNVFKKWLPKEKKEDKKPTKKNETKKPSNKKNNK